MASPLRARRAESVRRNDEAIRHAVIVSVAEEGWDGVTMSGVAKRAGLTVGAVYSRADNVAELGIDAWEARLRSFLTDCLSRLVEAQDAGDAPGVRSAFASWDAEPTMANATLEIVLASLFDDELAEVVGADVAALLGGWCLPSGQMSEHLAASHLLGISYFFGQALALLSGRPPHRLELATARTLASYPGAAPKRVRGNAPDLLWERDLTTLPSADADLMRATASVVSRVGYRRATFSRIARSAARTRGSVTGGHPDKAALVADAAYHQLIPPGEVWAQYAAVTAARGPLASRALFLQSFLLPDNKRRWAFNLELARMARTVPELANFAVGSDVLEQTHLGVMVAASFLPDVHLLPFYGPFLAGIAT